MLQHNIRLIFRGFNRFRLTFFINITGLASALICAIFIFLWISDEMKFDRFHSKGDRIFQIMENENTPHGIITKSGTTHFLADALAEEFPEVELAVVATPNAFFPKFELTDGRTHVDGIGRFAGEQFFNVFSFGLREDPAQVLSANNAIVLSEKTAMSLFNTVDVVGRTLQWKMMTLTRDVIVTGVFKDIPSHASEEFDFVLSFGSLSDIMHFGGANWEDMGPFNSYVVMKQGADTDLFRRKLATLISDKTDDSRHRTLQATSYQLNYLYGDFENGMQKGGRISYIKIFAWMAVFIVLMAAINFMNLFTARAALKAKEVGIKKTIGAKRSALIFQYFTEAVVMTLLALVVALVVVAALLPSFNFIAAKHISLVDVITALPEITGIAIFTGIIAGLYPAIYLSGFKPVVILKGQTPDSATSRWMRSGLVTFQFSTTIILMICVLVVYRQMDFVQTKSFGYDRKNLLYFETKGAVASRREEFLTALKMLPGVINASTMLGSMISGNGVPTMISRITINDREVRVNSGTVNYDIIETLGLKVIAGRSFSREADKDTMKVVINQAAVDALELSDPIGARLPGSNAEIIGVVDNFHYQSMHDKINPFIFRLEPFYAMTMLVRIGKGTEPETLLKIKSLYSTFNPGFTFDYKFLDADYQAQYAAEKRVEVLSTYLAVLAVGISCLGLLSLVHFSIEKRTKEMTIRKILGSTPRQIVLLLSGDFSKIMLISICTGVPVAYYITSAWLSSFAFRIDLTWWYFIVASGLALMIAVVTIGMQVARAAHANPAKALRSE